MNVEAYDERLREAARLAGFTCSTYGKVEDFALSVLTRDAGPDAPMVYISAGVHGNEPAGPMAVLDLLRKKALPDGLSYLIFPLINPVGLTAGTRENGQGIDLNRDYGPNPASYETKAHLDYLGSGKFDLVLCLHEDDDGTGFYIYSHLCEESKVDYPGLAIEAAKPWTGVDSRELIDDMPSRNGRMFPPASTVDPTRTDMPEALRLHFEHGARYTFTTETPSRFPVANRIAAQSAVVVKILDLFRTEHGLQ